MDPLISLSHTHTPPPTHPPTHTELSAKDSPSVCISFYDCPSKINLDPVQLLALSNAPLTSSPPLISSVHCFAQYKSYYPTPYPCPSASTFSPTRTLASCGLPVGEASNEPHHSAETEGSPSIPDEMQI